MKQQLITQRLVSSKLRSGLGRQRKQIPRGMLERGFSRVNISIKKNKRFYSRFGDASRPPHNSTVVLRRGSHVLTHVQRRTEGTYIRAGHRSVA